MAGVSQFPSSTQNIQILSSSMQEHSAQVHRNLAAPIHRFFYRVFLDAQKEVDSEANKKTRFSDLRLFQEKLRFIPRWSQKTVDQVYERIASWLPNKRFDLGKVLKALVVGRTMLLVSIARQSGNAAAEPSVKIDVPDAPVFLHNVLCLAAQHIYRFPSLLRIDDADTEEDLDKKTHKVRGTIHQAIDDAILDLLPSESVNNFLEGAMASHHFEAAAPVAPAPAPAPPAATAPAPPTANEASAASSVPSEAGFDDVAADDKKQESKDNDALPAMEAGEDYADQDEDDYSSPDDEDEDDMEDDYRAVHVGRAARGRHNAYGHREVEYDDFDDEQELDDAYMPARRKPSSRRSSRGPPPPPPAAAHSRKHASSRRDWNLRNLGNAPLRRANPRAARSERFGAMA